MRKIKQRGRKSDTRTQAKRNSSHHHREIYSENLTKLHRRVGNQAVQRVVESGTLDGTLKVTSSNDRSEQEADRIAENVTHTTDPEALAPEAEGRSRGGNGILRGEVDNTGNAEAVTPETERRIRSSIGSGRPLTRSEQSFFEPRFGVDFHGVRIHQDAEAGTLNQALHSKAFTHGQDIYFGDRHNPNSSTGEEILAHELAHVTQQTGEYRSQDRIQRYPDDERETVSHAQPALAPPPEEVQAVTRELELADLLDNRAGELKSEVADAIDDWVEEHEEESQYDALVLALIAAPVTILGAVFTSFAIPVAVATSSISVIASVPQSDDPIDAFSSKMSLAFDEAKQHVQQNATSIAEDFVRSYVSTFPYGDVAEMAHFIRNALMRQAFGNVFTPVWSPDQRPPIDEAKVKRSVFVRLNQTWEALPQLRYIGRRKIEGPGGGPGPRLAYDVGVVWIDLEPRPFDGLALVKKLSYADKPSFVEFIDPAVKQEALNRARRQSSELPGINEVVSRSDVKFVPETIPARATLRGR